MVLGSHYRNPGKCDVILEYNITMGMEEQDEGKNIRGRVSVLHLMISLFLLKPVD